MTPRRLGGRLPGRPRHGLPWRESDIIRKLPLRHCSMLRMLDQGRSVRVPRQPACFQLSGDREHVPRIIGGRVLLPFGVEKRELAADFQDESNLPATLITVEPKPRRLVTLRSPLTSRSRYVERYELKKTAVGNFSTRQSSGNWPRINSLSRSALEAVVAP